MGSTSKSIDTGKTSVIIDNISYSFVKSVYEVTDLKESNYDKDIPSLEDNNKLMITKNGISILVTGENKSSTKVVKNKDIKVPRIVITTTTSQTTNAISNSPDEGKKTDYEIQIPNVQ